MSYDESILVQAHKFCKNNKADLLKSKSAGCFYCGQIIPLSAPESLEFVGIGSETGLCPKCGIDSLLPSSKLTPITKEFLQAMHNRWFSVAEKV